MRNLHKILSVLLLGGALYITGCADDAEEIAPTERTGGISKPLASDSVFLPPQPGTPVNPGETGGTGGSDATGNTRGSGSDRGDELSGGLVMSGGQ